MSSNSDPDLGKIITNFPAVPSAPPSSPCDSSSLHHAIYPDLSQFLGNLDHGSRGLTIIGAGCNTGAVVVLGVPGVGGIVSLTLASVSLGTTLFSGLLSTVSKTFRHKYEKHEAIRVLAASKLSSVVNYIGSISANKQIEARDVKVILQEVDDYKHQKVAIRKEYRQRYRKSQPLEKKEVESIMTMGRDSAKRDLFRFIESESDRKTQVGMAKIANKL
jgi:hypothetical protein